MMGTNIAKVLRYDYKQTGSDQIICVTNDGQVKGYALTLQGKNQTNENVFAKGKTEDLEEIYNELLKKKEVCYYSYKPFILYFIELIH